MAQGQSPVSRAMRARLLVLCGAVLGLLPPVVPSAEGAKAREVTMPVPRATIYPGTVMTEDMLTTKVFRAQDVQDSGIAATRQSIVGKVARKTLLPNVPVAIAGLREPFAVTQGQPAVVVFQSGGLVISGVAVSLQNGSSGDVISLRNTDSGTTIRGVVMADGTVRVGQP